MSAITYERLPSETPIEQTSNQASRRGRTWQLLKPEQDFLIGLSKLIGVQAIGFIIAAALGEISSQGDTARDLNLYLTDTYYKTCTQAENAFLTAMVSTGIYFLCTCTYGFFLKRNQAKCAENITPNMQVAIQHQIEEEIRVQQERT